MSKLAARKKRVKRTVSIGRVVPEAVEQVEDLDSRIEAIQWLIPLGLKAVTEELHRAVIELAGPRYQRKGSDQPLRRWGLSQGRFTWAIRNCLLRCRACATWPATPRSP